MASQQKNGCDGIAVNSLFDDQFFLLNFITGTYLGPDITNDNPQRSAAQRQAENSPSYMSTDLGPSYISVAMLENLYYYLLRKAHPDLILKPNMFHGYLKGSLHLPNSKPPEETWQFTSFFPIDLHKQIWYPASFRIVKGILLIDDPTTSQWEEKDLEKFRALTCNSCFKIDMDELVNFEHEYQIRLNGMDNGNKETLTGHGGSNGNKRSRNVAEDCCEEGDCKRTACISNVENCIPESEVSIVISGTARKGKAGPPVGVVDVGSSKVAYYFRVALPGVRKDYCKFSCEIESNGVVHVRGLTTGGKTIEKPSRVFEMKFQQLCPPGPFTLSFSLPGPVDTRLFAPNFRSDGIFEGVIIKHAESGT